MKRGEIWLAAAPGDYSGKPRPAVIVQADRFDETSSITICGLTTVEVDAPYFRLPLAPGRTNGLTQRSWIMADKITTVNRVRLSRRIGRLSASQVVLLDRAIATFLGLGGSPAPTREEQEP